MQKQTIKKPGVILITDNRSSNSQQGIKLQTCSDFRNSGFKQTDVDPHQERNEQFGEQYYDFNKLATKLGHLQKKMQVLENTCSQKQAIKTKSISGKNRRKFEQIQRKYQCKHQECGKIYGSETALRKHLKLKHLTSMNPLFIKKQQ